MTQRLVSRLSRLFLLATLAAPVGAQTSALAQGLAECRRLASDKDRLACYDALTPQSDPLKPAAAPEPAPPSTGSAGPGGTAGFGLSAPAPVQPELIETRWIGAFNGWEERQRLRLANGQLWQVVGPASGYYRTIQDPKVTITKGLLSGYFMKFEGANEQARVRRLE